MKLLHILLIYIVAMSAAFAAPGAHGPNGEHLDAPTEQAGSTARPRMETFTESFELVGHLTGDELTVVIDRYETNEPVVNGKLDVEFNGLKASARFHADHGDYAFDDPRLLAALAKPGNHALMFTLMAGNDSDLLEATLAVKEENVPHGEPHFPWAWAAAAATAALLLGLAIVQLRRRKTSTGKQ